MNLSSLSNIAAGLTLIKKVFESVSIREWKYWKIKKNTYNEEKSYLKIKWLYRQFIYINKNNL